MESSVLAVDLPATLLAAIDNEVGSEGRQAFLTEAAEAELRRRRLQAFLSDAEPAWRDEDHPELADGSYEWVRKLRDETEERWRRVSDRSAE